MLILKVTLVSQNKSEQALYRRILVTQDFLVVICKISNIQLTEVLFCLQNQAPCSDLKLVDKDMFYQAPL